MVGVVTMMMMMLIGRWLLALAMLTGRKGNAPIADVGRNEADTGFPD